MTRTPSVLATVVLLATSSVIFAGCGSDGDPTKAAPKKDTRRSYSLADPEAGIISASSFERPDAAEAKAACRKLGLPDGVASFTITRFTSNSYEWPYSYNVACGKG